MEQIWFYVLGVVVIVAGLALSIGLHEVGHLVPAKLFGVKVTQYMIGFGKTLWSRKRGETEYGIKLIPLGGYISMIGMFPPNPATGKVRRSSTGFFQSMAQNAREASAETIPEGEEDRAFYRLPIWKRAIIMLGGPTMNLMLGILFYAILVSGIGLVQSTTTLQSVSECVLPASSSSQSCDASDASEAPGAAAGLQPGDTIVAVNGVAVSTWDEITELIRPSAGKALQLTIERDGAEQQVTLTPLLTERYVYDETGQVVTDDDGNKQTEEVGFVGIAPTSQREREPLTQVLPTVGENISGVVNVIVHLPQRLVQVAQAAFSSDERDADGPMSIVGVGRVAGEIAASDQITVDSKVASMVGLLASLNIALFVFNLIPLMPLDGGHVAGAVYEGVRRGAARVLRRPDPGPFDAAKLMPLTMVVAALLFGMSLLLIYADIVKPISFFG